MGLRRGRSRLNRPVAALLLGLALGPALLAGCSGQSEVDESRLTLYRENSQNYFDRGEYLAALQQAGKALQLEPDLQPMLLMKGFCLLKLGQAQNNAAMIDESLATFHEMLRNNGGHPDFRVNLGIGGAGLARALEHDREIDRISKRLTSDFISAAGRADEQERLKQEQENRLECLHSAEAALRDVLADTFQKDNTYALLDFVLVLNSLGGHEQEALEAANHALKQLDEDTRIKQNTLDRNPRLDASARVDLQHLVSNNADKELALRDLIATIDYRNGNVEGFLEQMRILEERQLIGEVQYWNLAEVHEKLGLYAEAIGDLQGFLKLRAARMTYEQDDRASEVFQRLDTLRARLAAQTAR